MQKSIWPTIRPRQISCGGFKTNKTNIDFLVIGDFLLNRKNQDLESIKKEFRQYDPD